MGVLNNLPTAGLVVIIVIALLFVLAVALWLAARLVRRVAPDISGS